MTRQTLGAAERRAKLELRLADPRARWGEVLTLLACWPPEHDSAAALTRVEAEADRWSPHARTLPRLARQQLIDGEVRPYLRLIRALDLRELWQVRDHPALMRRMICEGGMRELVALVTRYDAGEPLIDILAEQVTGLRRLHIGTSAIGPDGAGRLASEPAFARLEHLGLPNNLLGDAGVAALLASPQLGGLHSLNVDGNGLSAEMVACVFAAPQWRNTVIAGRRQRF